ncbi:MAG: hypothetical protein IPG58_15640 [Acidobacteria bacterium]|nr:hypothetical protein [Acidobacteriota bacterium]
MRNLFVSPMSIILMFLFLVGSGCQQESRVVQKPTVVHESPTVEETPAIQKSPPVLQPNQPVSFSLAPGQETLFTLSMKKGALTKIKSSPLDGTVVSFELYDSQRKQLFERGEVSLFFFAPGDGDFLLVARLFQVQPSKNSETCDLEIHMPAFGHADTNDIRKVNGYEIEITKIRAEAKYGRDRSRVQIKKNGESLRIIDGDEFKFLDTPNTYPAADYEKQSAHLIATTWDKTGDGSSDIVFWDQVCGHTGRGCSTTTYFVELANSVKVTEFSTEDGLFAVRKNPKGGLLFRGDSRAILGFKNGALRPI